MNNLLLLIVPVYLNEIKQKKTTPKIKFVSMGYDERHVYTMYSVFDQLKCKYYYSKYVNLCKSAFVFYFIP